MRAKASNTFIFEEDVYALEPFKTFKENYMFWIKKYLNYVFLNQSTRLIVDAKLHKNLIKTFNSKNEMKDLREVINLMSRNGFKGPKTYFNPLNLFYDFLSENNAKSLKDIRTNSLRHFLNSELDEYSYTHKKNIYTAIKSFLLFVEENNYIGKKGDNHVFKIKKNIIKSIGKEKKTLSYLDPKSEFYTFLNGIDACTLWHKDCSTRNKLMLKILILTGIRVNELVRIKKSGIVVNETQMQIEIIGKGNKKRVTYLDDETTVSYYNSIKDLSKGEYLFESRAGKILNERYVNQLVKTVMLSTGITLKEKNGPHLLRHSCSTWLSVEGGLDIAKLQVFLAHEDIQTTRKYTHLDANVVQDISSVASKIRQKKFK